MGSFWSRNCIECETNGERNKTLLNDVKKFDTWKIQLTKTIKSMSSKEWWRTRDTFKECLDRNCD